MPSTVLVADDEKHIVQLIKLYLTNEGFRVETAADGQEALEKARRLRPDLIILDLMMPREETAQTFQRLRQRRPGVPVLLCTGLPQADPAPHLLQAGAVGLLRKPFRMNELWYEVNHALTDKAR